MLRSLLALLLVAFMPAALAAKAPTFGDFALHKERLAGYFPLLIDAAEGKVYLEVPKDRGEFIFQGSLARGVGSNDIGLDRGQLADNTRLVAFERVGKRALLRQVNTRYRADSDNAAERSSVEEAFASSVLWGFNIVFSDADRYVVDYTPFLLADVHQVVRQLKQVKQGEFKLDGERSAAYFPRTRAFPKNSELEATLTFTTNEPGDEVATVVPEPTSVTVHSHHSLVELPPPGFELRPFHPYSGFWSFEFVDYAQPLDQNLRRRFLVRHRLAKKDPTAARSEAVAPIVYYMDPGAPEPVRSALMDGARWWNSAFEAIGYINAFEVRELPPDADPMDIRYNVIQWVHRSTRGWSYGSSVVDPRTGEIIKGLVTLGSLRVRQDLLIAQGLVSPFAAGDDDPSLSVMALARMRQLAAHEVGHTLGLSHNFAASSNDRASVMDYPHPRLAPGAAGAPPVLADAYGVGLGRWDLFTIAYGYSSLPREQETQALTAMIERSQASGLRYITDVDSRGLESFNVVSHLWDEGTDVLAGLQRILEVRQASLARFGEGSIRSGVPWSELANVLVPVYYLHRYQAEAAARLVGGVDFDYAVKGDKAAMRNAPAAAAIQTQAIDALLTLLTPKSLALDSRLVARIPPPAFGYAATRESPPQRIGGALDPVTMAEAAAEQVLAQLLAPGRLARLQQQHAANDAVPDTSTLLTAIVARTLQAPSQDALAGEIQQRVNLLVVEHLLRLSYDDAAVPETQARAQAVTRDVSAWLKSSQRAANLQGHYRYLAEMIGKATGERKFERRKNVAQMPPGAPI